MTVLIVDDSKIMRRKLRTILTSTGLAGDAIREAGDGHEALDVVGHERVDVVFTDINMPGMDGRELLARLAARPSGQRPYTVVCTTETKQALKDELQQFGVDLYIEKPFDSDVVRDLIRRAPMHGSSAGAGQ